MKKGLLAAAILGVLALGGYWLARRAGEPREVNFVRVGRERLVSTLTTNGKVEPAEFFAVRSEREGAVARVAVQRGEAARKGQSLVELESAGTQAELASAEARLAQAKADLEVFDRGGAAAELAEIENGIAKTRLELEIAGREAESLERLAAKSAATRQEAALARDRFRRLEQEIRALENKREALLPPGGRAAAEARRRDAEAAVALARRRIEMGTIRSPIDGAVYHLAVRAGDYLRPGDLVAEVGRLARLKAIVWVDEPELGRVEKHMPVTITWDAEPGRSWGGQVERLPAQIVTLGTRQVGEVLCMIDNPDGRLPPGANVNAEIRSRMVEGALTVPKEALRREDGAVGVLVLEGERVAWREVKLGVSSLTHAEVVEGLREGEAVALPTEQPLAAGERVSARFR